MASSLTLISTQLRRHMLGLFGLCVIAWPLQANAANNCAWMNEATASGLLGGDAVGELTSTTSPLSTVCTFTRSDAGVKRTLQVTVEAAHEAHERLAALSQSCGSSAMPAKAIGNEAFVCTRDDKRLANFARAVGRVRDQVFTITIATSVKNDPTLSGDMLKSKIYTAAEQVAGNLF